MLKITTAAATAMALVASAAHADTFAIQAGRLIVDAAAPERGPSTVIVTDGRITGIEDGATAPAGATVVDMRTKTVMPGLIDVHVHLTSDANLPWYETLRPKYSQSYAAITGVKNALITARAGFTTVRDVGSSGTSAIAVRDAVRDGSVPGPRIEVSGQPLSMIGGHADPAVGLSPELRDAIAATPEMFTVCTGTEECSKAVRRLAAEGVDLIKFMATGGVLDPGDIGLEQHFSDAEMKAIIDTAHALHLKVAAHAHGAKGIDAAVRAGVDSVEHGTFVDAQGIADMKAHGTYYVATLLAFRGAVGMIGKGLLQPSSEKKARQAFEAWGVGLNRAYKGGIKIALGTDAGVFPHGQNAQEIGLMVAKGGMTPRDALIAATKGGADLMGLSTETGTLTPGKSADLIAVDGDPLVDPNAVTHVAYVMVMGKPIPMK
ncbi:MULTISPECIES: amidohydrolase family protein [unclassified Sphingomonas]|uniref:metal-dependent hydrolase family protein n=1 Tax=unclassified Sphingomonas TaxID=196159 RepID=UPI001F59AE64|nr:MULTISPECIES: amidohydrolase family protein [unclassified Sphingomonas]